MNPDVTNTEFQFRSLKEIFTDKFFIIPDYQRGYSWEIEQVQDLIKDIENLYGKDHKHYTGTIVAAKTVNTSNTYDLVDGQQRITSLVILLKQLYDFDPNSNADLFQLFIQRGSLGNEKSVLTPNEETRLCFLEEIVNNRSYAIEIKSHQCIISAKKEFKEWILKNESKHKEIKEIVTNRLGFIFFSPLNDKEIGIMFEVINNRGKALSELEKIKNYFIYYSTIHGYDTLRLTVNDNWKKLQRNLSQAKKTSNNDENTFLRNCYLVYFDDNKSKSWYVYTELKIRFEIKAENVEAQNDIVKALLGFIHFITEASLHYAYFYNEAFFLSTYSNDNKDELNEVLSYIRSQPVNASIMPLYLAIMSRLDQSSKAVSLLSLLEKVNFRLYVLPGVSNRADSNQGDLFFFANELYRCPHWHSNEKEPEHPRYNPAITHKGDIYDWLELELTEMIKRLCPLKKIVDVLTLSDDDEFDFYIWKGLRYLLACYEQRIQKDGKKSFDVQRILVGRNDIQTSYNDHLSIEHIWAKENRSDVYAAWNKEKRRLGNFVLMGLSANITLQHKDILDKIIELNDYNTNAGKGGLGMHQVAELSKFTDNARNEIEEQDSDYYLKLSTKVNDLREAEIINDFVLERWKLSDEPNFTIEPKVSTSTN